MFEEVDWIMENGDILEGKQKGKYFKAKIEKDGNPFYLLIEHCVDGNIKQVMEKPNFKEMEVAIHTSGIHMIIDFPERDHYDHYEGDKKWQEPKVEGQDCPYWVCGSIIGV